MATDVGTIAVTLEGMDDFRSALDRMREDMERTVMSSLGVQQSLLGIPVHQNPYVPAGTSFLVGEGGAQRLVVGTMHGIASQPEPEKPLVRRAMNLKGVPRG